ncbi:KAT8 regulatory NSL complex subunit 2-like [Acanthaster planci]|uniref:KAT8 regulatory NSL complex subunit 2 n=1 Tax=Acanthaster planci TaxID=133434 RepID=A0A8B7XXR4_ACAPL|nr:KAT8 regulatory NSL complex subunit 2-like [Acanthaster planci]
MHKSKTGHSRRHRSDGLFCNYAHRICMQDRLDGYEYCLNHILEDKNAPYKHCTFVSNKGGRRCLQPAHKADKRDGYCREHAQKVAVLRHKAGLKPFPRNSPREILDSLDRYQQEPGKMTPDALAEAQPSVAAKILDCASESESDEDPLQVDQAWRGTTDSDAESVDSEQEDLLKHAGVYTPEEVALITREKLIRLQSLYINQFKRLQHLMKEKRRHYLLALKQEKETIGMSLGSFASPKEKRKVLRLKSMQSYHRRHGREALLHKRSKHRRIKATPGYSGSQKVSLPARCKHTRENKPCERPALPITGFCLDHVLEDSHQVLYTPCTKGRVACTYPADPLSLEGTCLLHTPVAPECFRSANQQLEEESEQEKNASAAMADHDYLQRPSEATDASDHDVDILGLSGEQMYMLGTVSDEPDILSGQLPPTSLAENPKEPERTAVSQAGT